MTNNKTTVIALPVSKKKHHDLGTVMYDIFDANGFVICSMPPGNYREAADKIVNALNATIPCDHVNTVIRDDNGMLDCLDCGGEEIDYQGVWGRLLDRIFKESA